MASVQAAAQRKDEVWLKFSTAVTKDYDAISVYDESYRLRT